MQELKKEYHNLIVQAKKYKTYEFRSLPVMVYQEFYRNGNRTNYEALYFEKRDVLFSLLTAEYLQGDGAYIEQIANGIWSICEETTWILPAHFSMGVEPLEKYHNSRGLPENEHPQFIDLFSAETASLLAWSVYLLKKPLDAVSPEICNKIRTQILKRIICPLQQNQRMWWMGNGEKRINNWNPWILSNCIAVILILEQDERREAWSIYRASAGSSLLSLHKKALPLKCFWINER